MISVSCFVFRVREWGGSQPAHEWNARALEPESFERIESVAGTFQRPRVFARPRQAWNGVGLRVWNSVIGVCCSVFRVQDSGFLNIVCTSERGLRVSELPGRPDASPQPILHQASKLFMYIIYDVLFIIYYCILFII